MKDKGIRGFHFYTLNLEKSVRLILEGLGFVPPIEVVRPLPWNPVRLCCDSCDSLWPRTEKRKRFDLLFGEIEHVAIL
jgi:hypothetical protein